MAKRCLYWLPYFPQVCAYPQGHGSKGFDRYYEPYQKKLDAIMLKKGYNNTGWITEHFPGMHHA
jgi:hypothetical protein